MGFAISEDNPRWNEVECKKKTNGNAHELFSFYVHICTFRAVEFMKYTIHIEKRELPIGFPSSSKMSTT